MRKKHDSDQRVKVVHITKNLTANGISSVVLNYAKYIDKEKFSVTIIAGLQVYKEYKYDCEKKGIKVIEVPSKSESPLQYYLGIWNVLKNRRFDIVHIHGNSATIFIELLIAFLCGIKVRIAHCHNSFCEHQRVHRLLLPLFYKLYTKGYACSDLAGEWLFGDRPYEVIRNGFDTSKYLFSQANRELNRHDLGLDGKFVIGNVAGFNEQKNHLFLLDIFEKIADKRADAVLFLVGEGYLLDQIQKRIELHPYKERIIYYGISNHVEDLYNVMDVFVLPSKYEGLGLVFLEAQINGLYCFASDCVPSEVNMNGQTKFISLDKEPEKWADCILQCICDDSDRNDLSNKAYKEARAYDIKQCALHLENEYLCFVQ